jgi:hypothetical protein
MPSVSVSLSPVPLSLSKERVGERSSDDSHDPLKVRVAQQNSEEPLPPLAMLAATSPGTRRGKKSTLVQFD